MVRAKLAIAQLLLLILMHISEAKHSTGPVYVEYYPGDADSKIVISCPHDGTLKPVEIPDRVNGCYNSTEDTCDYHLGCGDPAVNKCKVTTIRDRHASRMALEMKKVFEKRLGSRPHLIISRLARTKMDPNRPINLAANHNPLAEEVYNMFHGYIQTAHDAVTKNGPGLHIDVHGYTKHNADNWIELGYNIQPADLNAGNFDTKESSIRSLAEGLSDKMSFEELINGPDSLGSMVQSKGYKVVPSPKYPTPDSGNPGEYYRGGDITRKWGSLNGGSIDCIQIEFPQWIRDVSTTSGPKIADAFVEFIVKYY